MVLKFSSNFASVLIKRRYLLAIFIYLFVIVGLTLKCYFNFPGFMWGFVLTMQIATIYGGITTYILSNNLNTLKNSDLSHDELIFSINVIENKFNTEFHNRIKIFLILLISFLLGCFGMNSNVANLTDLIIHISSSFGASIVCMFMIAYDFGISKDKYNSVLAIFAVLGVSAILLKVFGSVFLNILNIISSHLNNFFILSLTVVLLCATLALLAFTYNMVLTDDKNTQDIMKTNGEYFFIATIFSMFFLALIFALSLYCEYCDILNLATFNFLNLMSFLRVNLFEILFMGSFISLSYSLYYLLKGINSSLRILLSD